MPIDIMTCNDEQALKKYYELWKQGKTNEEIMKALDISKGVLDGLAPELLTYCRKAIKEETRISLTKGNLPDGMKLTPARRKEFIENMEAGCSVQESALLMNVPLVTVMDVWFVEDPDFKHLADTAQMRANTEAVKALIKRAQGYDLPIATKTVTEGMLDKMGREMTVTSTTKTKKHVEPSVKALEVYLYNRLPEKFSKDGAGSITGAKGKLLMALEAALEPEEGDSEFKEDGE